MNDANLIQRYHANYQFNTTNPELCRIITEILPSTFEIN